MTRKHFHKQATTYAEQIQKLKTRGLLIKNDTDAEFYLKHLNYYRLGAYWLPFEEHHDSHTFKAGTRFEDILNLYSFAIGCLWHMALMRILIHPFPEINNNGK
jgi:abortive infection bacteriophage resistance protein